MTDSAVVHVIDDDDALRDSLSFLFDSADIPVATYPSALAFLEALPGIATGCVVTDIRMPEMSGMDLLRHLRDRASPLQVIVMTGHGDVPLAVEAMRLGAADFIEKPFDDEVLIAAVRSAVGAPAGSPAGHRGERRDPAQDRLPVGPRAPGPRWPRRRQPQQADRLRAGHQPAHRRDLPRQPHDQDAGRQPVGTRPHGAARRPAGSLTPRRRV
jgi:DNA-binding response OmpR family regulator